MQTTGGISATRGGSWVARLARVRGGALGLELVSANGDAQLAESGPCRVLFAGLLQDRPELSASSEDARTAAELVAEGYLREGEAFLAKLRGVFAIILTDSRHDVGICVRDQIGRHSLFWAEEGDDVVLSASPKALIARPGVSSAVNISALVDHLRRRWPFAEETYYEAVRRVPPSHALRLTPMRREVVRYWDPVPLGEPVDWLSADEADRFGDVLETAVRRSLRDGPAGIFLSGGLDSVAVASLASASARELNVPDPWALSLAFPRPDVSEEEIQRRVATDLRLPQVMLPWEEAVGPDGLVHSALELSARGSAPLASVWSPAYDRLAQEGQSRGCRVILTGSGGDEWLGVSPYYAADLLRMGNVVALYRLYTAQRLSYQSSPLLFARNILWRFGARRLLVGAARGVARRTAPTLELATRVRRAAARTPDWVAPGADLQARIIEREYRAHANLVASEQWLSQPLPRRYPRNYLVESRTAVSHPLTSLGHEETFEQAQRVGLHVLQPFWDVDVVNFLYRTPPEELNRGGRSKGVVRETLARRFPELGFESQRKVSAFDFSRWLFLEEGRRAWQSYGGVPTLIEAGIVHPQYVNRAVEAVFRDAQGRGSDRVWDLLTSESWLRAQG